MASSRACDPSDTGAAEYAIDRLQPPIAVRGSLGALGVVWQLPRPWLRAPGEYRKQPPGTPAHYQPICNEACRGTCNVNIPNSGSALSASSINDGQTNDIAGGPGFSAKDSVAQDRALPQRRFVAGT